MPNDNFHCDRDSFTIASWKGVERSIGQMVGLAMFCGQLLLCTYYRLSTLFKGPEIDS